MTGIHPAMMTRTRRHTSIPVLLVAVLLGGWAPAAVADGLSTSPAKDALALLYDNQDRCLKVAHRYQARVGTDRRSNRDRARAGERFIAGEGRYDLEVASRALRLIGRLVTETGGSVGAATKAGLIIMFRAQEKLHGAITQPGGWQTTEGFEAAISEARYAFTAAESVVSSSLVLSSGEQREILDKYAAELLGGPGNIIAGEYYDPLAREMTPEEYAKKKEEYADWLAEQERIEAERIAQIQERREALEERARTEGAAAPGVGLSSPPPLPATPPPPLPPKVSYGTMKSWHKGYSSKIYSVKMAISQYIQVRKNGSSRMLAQSCSRMSEALEPVLADPKVLGSPDPVVAHALKTSMTEFKQGADVCRLQPDAEQVKIHMKAAEQALAAAAGGLGRYRLAP